MGSGHVHTTLTFEVTDSEGALRCRTKRLKQINLDTISGENVSYGLSKETTIVTAVVAYYNGYAAVLYILEPPFALYFEQVVSIALGGLRYDVLVHSVGTRAHNTAQTTCTELKAATI